MKQIVDLEGSGRQVIKYKKGDLLKALADHEVDIIGHGTNCSNGFGSGIAGQIAKKYPQVKESFHEAFQDYRLGDCQLCYIEEGMEIANCYTQESYGYNGEKYVCYEAVESSLKKLHNHAKKISSRSRIT